jgi:hypothetical protein
VDTGCQSAGIARDSQTEPTHRGHILASRNPQRVNEIHTLGGFFVRDEGTCASGVTAGDLWRSRYVTSPMRRMFLYEPAQGARVACAEPLCRQ